MNVTVTKQAPPPQIAPPTTYTLTLSGVTEREMRLLRTMCNASHRIPNMLSAADGDMREPRHAGRELMALLSKMAGAVGSTGLAPMGASEFNT